MANTLKLGAGKWATGTDTVLAFNDENNNFKPLPFDFSRASSATVVNQSGLIETVGSGEPRIDFQGNTKGALLLEPQRTNIVTYSEQLNNGSGWINQLGSTVIGNQSGVGNSTSAWKLNKASGTFKSLRFQSTLSSNNYTLSWYLKKGSLEVVEFRFDGGASAQFIDFNLSTGVAGTNNALTNIKMELINNEWYRCQASYNSALTNVHLYLGDASSTTEEGYVYAQSPQLEQGSYATSYIPTNGSAVTRVAESSSQTVPENAIGQTEGTLFLDVKPTNFDGDQRIGISDGTSANRIVLRLTSSVIQLSVVIGSSTQASIAGSGSAGNRYKIAGAYKENDFVIYINGVLAHSDNSGSISGTFNRLGMDRGTSGSNVFYNPITNFQLYNTRLSNAELQALTTI